MGLLDGLIMGFTQGLQERSAQKQASDARQIQMEYNALTTLAQSSDDPEIQSAAIAGLMELSQGKRKSSGFLGIGKLTQLPAFQKINEIASRLRGKREGGGATTPPPGPDGGVQDMGAQTDLGGLLNGLIGGAGGGSEAPPPPSGAPAAPMSAALPSTSPTQTAPTAAAAGAIPGAPPIATATPTPPPPTAPVGGPPGPPGMPFPEVPRSDYGTVGPTGGVQIQAIIRGQETEKDRAKYEAQLRLETARVREREKLQEDRQRQADKSREDQQAAAAELQRLREDRSDARASRREAGLEGRLSAREDQRDKEAARKEEAAVKKARSAALARIELLSAFPEDHPQHLTQQAAIQAKQGIWTEYPPGEDEEAPRFMALPGGVGMVQPLKRRAPAATPPPSVPTAGGPPGPPPDTSQVPNWPKLKSAAEQQRRAGKSPQEILAMASAAGLLPIQLQALRSYLRIP